MFASRSVPLPDQTDNLAEELPGQPARVTMGITANRLFWSKIEGVESVKRRFWEKVDVRLGGECWPWTANKGGNGYGKFKVASYHTVNAHRVAWALFNSADPGESLVLHSCDNPLCANPSHLRLGTHEDNMQDKIDRGRCRNGRRSGEANGNAKLSSGDVATIVAGFQVGMNNTQIAAQVGVHHATISLIRLGRIWQAETAALGWRPAKPFERPILIPGASA